MSIEQKQGLINYCNNIKPLMLKMEQVRTMIPNKPIKLSGDEQERIVNFYLEVVNYLSEN